MSKKGLIIAIALLTVGFASVATVLTITGRVNINFNQEDYQIYFSKAVVDDVDKSYEVIDPDTRQTINYTTSDLSKAKEQSILEYEVTNNSTQYDATVVVECKAKEKDTEKANEYVTINNQMDGDLIKAQTRKKGKVIVELQKVTVDPIEIEFTCELTVNPVGNEELKEPELAENSCRNIGIPSLGEGDKLIPIVFDEEGKAIRVDKNDSNWFDYCKREWANAVILNENVDSQKYKVGSQIEDTDIESYFVWIPKYKYKLWNVKTNNKNAGKHSIDIIFDTENTTEVSGESCVTPMNDDNTQGLSGNIKDCSDGEYMTHPAFISFGVNGFWVGKFETGYKDAQSKSDAEQDNADSSHITIKPGVYSWRNITVKNIFDVSKNYENTLESHMMKNTEWGAVAYLSHSIFGINKEITINNNNQYKTGYTALLSTNQSKVPGDSGDGGESNTEWNTENSFIASTTGNITGIYDMSGGAWEYVAAYVADSSNDKSGLIFQNLSDIDKKYFDVYDNASAYNSYNKMILGDATGEMGPFNNYQDGDNNTRYHSGWYGDASVFADASWPWFARGGDNSNGIIAGQFDFDRNSGGIRVGHGFRIVLAP